MKKTIWVSLLFLAACACNPVTDKQPQPGSLDEVPLSAIQTVTNRFPQAEGIIFKTLEKNRVWQVSFDQKAIRYSAATNENRLLVAYQLDDRSVPDSLTALVNNTVIEGGTFSNLRVQNYSWYQDGANNGQFIFADYAWKGNRYTFRWTATNIKGKISYVTELFPFYQLEYRTTNLTDLPSAIRESIQNKQLEFDYATVQVDQKGGKQYAVAAKQNTRSIQLLYTNDGLLINFSDTQQMQTLSSLDQLPLAIQTYLQRTPELAGFGLGGQFTMLGKMNHNQLETYQVNLQKGRQTWFMLFNDQGQILTRTYLNLI